MGGGWWQMVTRFTLEVEGNEKPCFGELDDLGVGGSRSRPALDIGRLGPPAVGLMVIDDANGLHSILHVRVASGLALPSDGVSQFGARRDS
jgi:hypothetical protein